METDQFTTRLSNPEQVVQRQVSRVLLLRSDRVLLLRGHDPAEPSTGYWFTIGGAIEADETPRETASRKLREDIGVTVDPADFDQPIWGNTTQFSHNGVTYRQYQRFFCLRIDGDAAAISATAVPEDHRDSYGHQWWSAAELRATNDPFYPVELPELLVRLSSAPDE